MEFKPIGPQNDAITAPLGPTLVLAGPGSGKTFCLIERIDHLIEVHGTDPARICAVTFTNRAAEEICTRLEQRLVSSAGTITRGTLHSLCVTILRGHVESPELTRGFGIADESRQLSILRHAGIYREGMRKYLLGRFGLHRLKGETLPPDEDRVFREYISQLRQRNLVDFDDIITLTAKLLTERPEVAAAVASRWDHVLIDEFQDLNAQQYSIVKQLAYPHQRIFAVGDDEQSIFSWTGADPRILERFYREYEAYLVKLDENHRCTCEISDTARRLVEHKPSLFEKKIRAVKQSWFPVKALAFETEEDEASWLIADIEADSRESGLALGEYAILYRLHDIGRYLESRLLLHGMRCRLARGQSVRDDSVIQYVAAALRVILAPDDSSAVEALAERMLPEHLFKHLQMTAGTSRFLGAVRAFAASSRGEVDGKMAWRFFYHVGNLPAIRKSHDSLVSLVDELITQRFERYSSVLEECAAELSDPARDPNVVELAGDLEAMLDRGSALLIEPARGLEIALHGMLDAAGYSASYLTEQSDPAPGDVVLSTRDPGGHARPFRIFKALQLLQSHSFQDQLRDYVIFDLETTDKHVATCDIIEIGAVKVMDGRVVDEFQSLVRSTHPVSDGAREIHGYSDADLRDAPPFEEIWPRFREFIGDLLLVAHNACEFDVPLLRRSISDAGHAANLRFYDTLPLARLLFPGGQVTLKELGSRFGISPWRYHHALPDAKALEQVFREMKRLKQIVARKSAQSNLLDYLGLGLALDSKDDWTEEYRTLFEKARIHSMGRYSKCLEFYADECERFPEGQRPDVEEIIEKLGGHALRRRLLTEKTPDERYPESIPRLRVLIAASQAATVEESIQRFLEIITLSASDGVSVDANHVNLLTLHSTKGLEFSRVYVVGAEDSVVPGNLTPLTMPEAELDEARRLLYVGMTRAEDRLLLTRVKRRDGKDSGGSKFLDEMGLVPEAPSLHVFDDCTPELTRRE